MCTCSTWSEDVHVVLGLSSLIFFNFFFYLLDLDFFRCDMMMWVACGYISAYSFIPNFLKLFRCFYHGLKVCMSFGYNSHVIFCHFFLLFPLSFFYALLLSEYTTCVCNFYSFPQVIMKFCRFILHVLKMCICFWGYPPFIFLPAFPLGF